MQLFIGNKPIKTNVIRHLENFPYGCHALENTGV